MFSNTFYIFEHPNGNRFWGYDKENCCFSWNHYLPEQAEKFDSYNSAKSFLKSNNIFVSQYIEDFINCKIRKVTVYTEISDCDEGNISN